MSHILNRLREPSTYAGLAVLASTFGVSEPVYQAAASIAAGLASLLSIFLSEKSK